MQGGVFVCFGESEEFLVGVCRVRWGRNFFDYVCVIQLLECDVKSVGVKVECVVGLFFDVVNYGVVVMWIVGKCYQNVKSERCQFIDFVVYGIFLLCVFVFWMFIVVMKVVGVGCIDVFGVFVFLVLIGLVFFVLNWFLWW